MISHLEEFKEPMDIEGYTGTQEAYRMDGQPPKRRKLMRKKAGFGGSLFCCDYLRVDGDRHILIEDTQLDLTIENLGQEYETTDSKYKKKNIKERVVREICLKVYGSMLMLCRLGVWPKRQDRVFWLVNSGEPGHEKLERNLDLHNDIMAALEGKGDQQAPAEGGLLGAKLVGSVEVMSVRQLDDHLLKTDR